MKVGKRLIKHAQNTQLFDAIEASVLASLTGTTLHIHAEGLRGTGKTTIIRSAKQILPTITRIKGCLYNCNPKEPHCPAHRTLSAERIAEIGTEEIPMPFVEISHSAKIGTVVGSIDLAKLTGSDPSACLLPGLIAQSHRGILFIDEVNRLADTSPELADVLLDVMGTKPGRIQIEEVGLPKVEMPVQVSVWAASNPDEEPGSLAGIRRQLSDRFDLLIPIKRPTDVDSVTHILLQSVAGLENADPWGHVAFGDRADRLGSVIVSPDLAHMVAGIYVDFNIESIRAMEALLLAARLTAVLRGSSEVELIDIRRNLSLSLAHRIDQEVINDIARFLEDRQRQEQIATALPQPGQLAPQPSLSSGLEDHVRPLSGPATCADDYRQATMPLSSMINQLLQKLWGTRSVAYMPSSVPPSSAVEADDHQQAGSGLTGGQQTGVGPGVFTQATDLHPVAPGESARPIEVLAYTEIIKGPEELRP